MADWKASVRASNLTTGQQELFPLTITGILPDCPQGAHVEFLAEAGNGRYYCKRDKNGTPLRAAEWFFTSLAQHLNIPSPDFSALRNPANGEVLFGSKEHWGTEQGFAVQTFLTTPQIADRAVGAGKPWLASYLSRLYVFDLFVGNPDRQLSNFLLQSGFGTRRLLAFDYASADLWNLSSRDFHVAETPTLLVGRRLRALHGFDAESAAEMLDWISAVPRTVAESIVESMPDDWLTGLQKGKICDHWSDGGIGIRLAALRSGLRDESLL